MAGWGVFGLPLGFIAIGLWLVLRKFGDKLPKLEYERLVGLVDGEQRTVAELEHIAVVAQADLLLRQVAADRVRVERKCQPGRAAA